MELPVILVPVDESLEIERDAACRHFIRNRDVVAVGDRGSAKALCEPILIELDMNIAVRRPDGVNVPDVVAERLVVRVAAAAVHRLESLRTVAAVERVRVEIDPVDLDESRHLLVMNVRNGAGRGERPLVRDAAIGGVHLVLTAGEGLGGVRRAEDVRYRDQGWRARNVGIPGCQRRGSCYRGLIGSGRTHAAQEDQRCSKGENHRRRDPISWKAKSRHSWPPSGAPARMDVYETYVYTPSQAVTSGSDNPYPGNPDFAQARDTASKAETAGTGNWKTRRFAGNALARIERSRL